MHTPTNFGELRDNTRFRVQGDDRLWRKSIPKPYAETPDSFNATVHDAPTRWQIGVGKRFSADAEVIRVWHPDES